MSGTITPITQRILARLTGIELPLVKVEVRATLTDFLSKTLLWRDTVLIPAVSGQEMYALMPPQVLAGVVGSRVLTAYYGESPMAVAALNGVLPASGVPTCVDLSESVWLRVWPVPDDSNPLQTIRLNLVWGMDPTAIDPEDLVLPRQVLGYIEGITEGALARLYAIPDRPWSSLNHAAMHERKYRKVKLEARRAAEEGRGRMGGDNWRFPPFA
jgi:hypothetical protein